MTPNQHERSYGSVEQLDDGRWQLRFTRQLPYPKAKVWHAITEPEHLTEWFPTTIEGERTAGATLRFMFPGGQAPAPGYCMSLTEERRAALRDRIRSTMTVKPDGSIHLIARAWAVRGQVE